MHLHVYWHQADLAVICITIIMVSVTRMIIESDLCLVVDWEISHLWIMVSFCFTILISWRRSVFIKNSVYKVGVFFQNMQNNYTRCMCTDIECGALPPYCYFILFSFYFYFFPFCQLNIRLGDNCLYLTWHIYLWLTVFSIFCEW